MIRFTAWRQVFGPVIWREGLGFLGPLKRGLCGSMAGMPVIFLRPLVGLNNRDLVGIDRFTLYINTLI